MNCKKCGFQLAENDQFCKNCGTPVNNISVQNNNEGLGNKSIEMPSAPQPIVREQVTTPQPTSPQPVSNYAQAQQQPVDNIPRPISNVERPAENIQQQVTNVQQSVNKVQPQMSTVQQSMNSVHQPVSNMQQPMNNTSQSSNNIQQPSNNVTQPSWTNGYNYQQTNSVSQKNDNTKFIIIGIAIAVVVVGIFIGIIAIGGKKSGAGTNNGGSSATNNSNSSYTVKFNGFTFKIPTNLVYETQTDAILLGDEEGTWVTYIEVMEGSYSQVLSKKNQLQGLYQSMGYTSSAAVEKTISGMPFITLELSKGGTNALLGIAKANSMNMFGITAYNMDNEYDYKLLETVSSILSSAEYSGATNNMSVFEKPNMNGIAELAK